MITSNYFNNCTNLETSKNFEFDGEIQNSSIYIDQLNTSSLPKTPDTPKTPVLSSSYMGRHFNMNAVGPFSEEMRILVHNNLSKAFHPRVVQDYLLDKIYELDVNLSKGILVSADFLSPELLIYSDRIYPVIKNITKPNANEENLSGEFRVLLAIEVDTLNGTANKEVIVKIQMHPTLQSPFAKEIRVFNSIREKNISLKNFDVILEVKRVVENKIKFVSFHTPCECDFKSITYPEDTPASFILPKIIDLLTGISLLHSEGYAHGDIKGGNFLMNREGPSKVTDFGSLERIVSGKYHTPGTPLYADPENWESLDEQFDKCGYQDFESDKYSFGMFLLYDVVLEIVSQQMKLRQNAHLHEQFAQLNRQLQPVNGLYECNTEQLESFYTQNRAQLICMKSPYTNEVITMLFPDRETKIRLFFDVIGLVKNKLSENEYQILSSIIFKADELFSTRNTRPSLNEIKSRLQKEFDLIVEDLDHPPLLSNELSEFNLPLINSRITHPNAEARSPKRRITVQTRPEVEIKKLKLANLSSNAKVLNTHFSRRDENMHVHKATSSVKSHKNVSSPSKLKENQLTTKPLNISSSTSSPKSNTFAPAKTNVVKIPRSLR